MDPVYTVLDNEPLDFWHPDFDMTVAKEEAPNSLGWSLSSEIVVSSPASKPQPQVPSYLPKQQPWARNQSTFRLGFVGLPVGWHHICLPVLVCSWQTTFLLVCCQLLLLSFLQLQFLNHLFFLAFAFSGCLVCARTPHSENSTVFSRPAHLDNGNGLPLLLLSRSSNPENKVEMFWLEHRKIRWHVNSLSTKIR